MLQCEFGPRGRNCESWTRRDFVAAGLLGLGSLTLPQLLAAKEAGGSKGYVRDKSIVLLFLGGGASHIETFNPNLDAPAPYASITGEVKTPIPGITLGGTFPQLAEHARRLTLVRSFQHSVGSHPQAIAHVLSGGVDPVGDGKRGYSMGSVYAKIRGANHPDSGIPTYAIATSSETDGQYRTERGRIENGSKPGSLGLAFAPFDPSGGGTLLKNLQLKIEGDRLDDRRSLLAQLDNVNRGIDAGGQLDGLDKFSRQALEMIVNGAGQAFDISQEDRRTRERYDTSKFRVGKKVFQPSSLGKQMLLARRLCEAGCGFVTVQNSGWDMHADGNNPGVAAGMEMLGRPLDKAVSTFLADIDERGLADDILLIITGDFGRTPKINSRGGRDHYPKLCTLALAGGGLNMGQTIGQSRRDNSEPATEPIGPAQLLSTVLHTLFDVGQLRLDSSVSRELITLAESPPIAELF
jgi:uncharacterized protein (DUF1501 family)